MDYIQENQRMKISKNNNGEEIYLFDEYPGIEVRPEVITPGDIAESSALVKKGALARQEADASASDR